MDRADLLAGALESLRGQRRPPGVDLEVIVVDNGSRDASLEVAKRFGARTIALGSNLGVSKALNRGIEAAHGDWVAILNNDVGLAADWLDRLLAGAVREGAWFATGKVYDAARRHVIDGAGDGVCRGGAAWRLGHGRPDCAEFCRPRPTYFPSATASLFRRRFFDQAGRFDESFFAYLEDIDLGMRAAARGLRGVYLPQAEAWHRGSATVGQWSDRTVRWITRHQWLLLAKHYSEGMLLRFGREIAVAQFLWAAQAFARGRPGSWLRGFTCGLADFRAHWRSGPRAGEAGLVDAIEASEGEIAGLQAATGWDTFWRLYFCLAGPVRVNPT